MSGTLSVEDLRVRFGDGSTAIEAVRGVSLELRAGEIVGIVGASGCGKSTLARSCIRLESPGEIVGGSIRFGGTDLTTADERTLQRIRGQEIAMVFQDPTATLNPAYPVGEQIAEAMRIHRDPETQPFVRELLSGVSRRFRSDRDRAAAIDLMDEVGIPQPEERIDAYPHQFSGGMRQRAMLAIALAREPAVLIADEPTTALDTTTQAAVLDRIAALSEDRGMGTLLISHDLDVVTERCDRIAVMYDGVIVESGPAGAVSRDPAHPYTKALFDCPPGRSDRRTKLPTIPQETEQTASSGCVFAGRCPFATDRCRETEPETVSPGDDRTVRCDVLEARSAASIANRETGANEDVAVDGGVESGRSGTVLATEGLSKTYREAEGIVDRLLGGEKQFRAVSGVTIELRAGETLGIVGESGCGKSTLIRVLAGLEPASDGTIRLRDDRVGVAASRTASQLAEVGVVFQHPAGGFNPRLTVGESIVEPLVEAGWTRPRRERRLSELLSLVDLPAAVGDRTPEALSGGQLQRAAIARAIALEPSVLLLDEPTTGLDASTEAVVLNLLSKLQREFGLGYLFISHDIAAVGHVADRIATMDGGEIVEIAPAERTLSAPEHPQTRALLEAVPGPTPGADRDRSKSRRTDRGESTIRSHDTHDR